MIPLRTIRRIIAAWQRWRFDRLRPEVAEFREHIAECRRHHKATRGHVRVLRMRTHDRLRTELGRGG